MTTPIGAVEASSLPKWLIETRLPPKVVAITPAASVTLDCFLTDVFTLAPTINTTVTPINQLAGVKYRIIITGDAGGGDVVSFGSGFTPGTPSLTLAASTVYALEFVSDGTSLTELGRGLLGYSGLINPVSKIVGGASSLTLRNNADTADNLLVSDAGNITSRGTWTATGTKPTTVAGSGTSFGQFWSVTTPAGGDSTGAGGGNAGSFNFTSGQGGAAASVSAGAGGTGGAHNATLGAGGPNTNGQGGVGGSFVHASGAGGAGNTSGVGTAGAVSGSGGAGGAHTYSTGAGGTGDGTGATSGAGGAGGAWAFTAGAGGVGANGGANSSRGGNGGAITWNTGAGGNGSNTGAGSGNGGAGGVHTINAGAGGSSAQVGSGTGAGGAGGAFVRVAGAGGIGAPAGLTSAQNLGGLGGTFTYTAGVGGASAGGSGGPGGFYLWTAGTGGASTSTTGSVAGGAIGYFKFVGGSGGSSTNGNGGAGTSGSSIIVLPISSMTAGFVVQMGNGGNTTFATGTAGAGAGVYFLTGNAGTTPSATYSKGGDFDIVLGTGNDPDNTPGVKMFGAGRHGIFQIFAPWLTGATPYELNGANTAVFTVNSMGIGIGAAAGLGTPLNCAWTVVDPTYNVNGLGSNIALTLTHDIAGSWAMQGQAAGIHLTGPGAMNLTLGGGVSDDEIHIYSTPNGDDGSGHPTGPNHGYVRGTYGKFHIEQWQSATHVAGFEGGSYVATPTPADVNQGYGGVFEAVHEGTGTLVRGVGVYGSIVSQQDVNEANAWRNPQWGVAYSFQGHATITGTKTAASGNNTIIPTLALFYASTPNMGTGQTSILTNAFGFIAEAMRNTSGATTNVAGLTLIGGGAKLFVGTQTATAASDITNVGLYVTGNGGGAGSGGATTHNYAIYSDSTAPSSFAGPLYTKASAAGGAGLRVPHGVAPTAPVDGDAWTTTAGVFWRVNGVTKSVNLT